MTQVMDRPRTIDAAKGRWRDILKAVGVDEKSLSGRNGPCPMCGGEDRFMFDDKDGSGSWVCRQGCSGSQAGYGLQLVMAYRGCDWAAAAKEVDGLIGNARVDTKPARRVMSWDECRAQMKELWDSANPIQEGDAADVYLQGRGLHQPYFPPSLRLLPACQIPGHPKKRLPVLLARIDGEDGRCVQLQRTYIDPDMPNGKAEMPNGRPSREFMPFPFPDGCKGAAVRLGPVSKHIGIAEGVETALAASRLGTMTVWACLNGSLLKKWTPPEGVERVTVWADNDGHYVGQAAGYIVANRIQGNRSIDCEIESVRIPARPGADWLDEYNRTHGEKAA